MSPTKTVFASILVFSAPAAMAQTPAAPASFTQSPAYLECTKLASTNPLHAEQKATEWLKLDDGVGANHCRAMALYGQRRFAEAAEALALVRSKLARENVNLRSYITRQASKAWVEAGRPDNAIALLGTQITDIAGIRGNNAAHAKLTSELLLERARLRATYGQAAQAVQDLDHAVSLTPTNEDVLLERAAAFAQLGDTALAQSDVAVVLRLNPGNTKAQELQRVLAPKAPATGL